MLGLFSSRVLGLVREVLLAFVGGAGAATDVLAVAFRGPNLVQNLLGEQALSASFVPVYSRLLAEGRAGEARRFAGAAFGILALTAASLALAGVVLARWLVIALAPGFHDDPVRFEAAIDSMRLIFPMTAVLVLSSWCLAVLTSHRRFFLPYFAPVLWNASLVGALVWLAARPGTAPGVRELVLIVSGAALAGGILQLALQLPAALRLVGGLDPRPSLAAPGVRPALRAFGPALLGRGVVQLSGWLDLILGSWLATGALAALNYAQRLHALPLALFGTSFAVVDLPELARMGDDQDAARRRVASSFAAAAFLTVPASVGLMLFGLPIVRAIYERGRFGSDASWLVYGVLAAYSAGLLPTVASRLRQNLFYAAGDTRTPAVVALGRVILAASSGALLMFWLDRFEISELVGLGGGTIESGARAGAIGLAAGSALGAWFELWTLGYRLDRRYGVRAELPWARAAVAGALALGSSLPAFGVWLLAQPWPAVILGPTLVVVFASVYLGTGWGLRLPEARGFLDQVQALVGRRGAGSP
jgi:putative peptidoglycan lipid II flippase